MNLIDNFDFNRTVLITKRQYTKKTGSGKYLKPFEVTVYAVVGTVLLRDTTGVQIVSEQQFIMKIEDANKVDVDDIITVDGLEMPIVKKLPLYDIETAQMDYVVFYV